MNPTNLLIRLSDESSWACAPFTAASPADLRDGCLEEFAAFRAEWSARGAATIPAHQTTNVARHEASRPHDLLVQVCYHGEWCAQPFTPVVREPGTVPKTGHAWVDADWADAWERCLRTWLHVHGIGAFAHRVTKP